MEFDEEEPPVMPPGEPLLSVLDASAVLVLLFDEPGAKQVADAIADGAALSTVNYSEAAAVLARNEPDAERVLGPVREQVALQPFTVEDAIAAAALAGPTRSIGLSLGDRACVALAQRLSARVVTADRQWADLDLGVTVQLVRPAS
jgi:PIN domain nuclease of toxin-antitoxin system